MTRVLCVYCNLLASNHFSCTTMTCKKYNTTKSKYISVNLNKVFLNGWLILKEKLKEEY